MTKDYLVNPCQMSINYYSGNNFEAYRKALIGEAFIMFLGFFLSQLYRAILKRQNQKAAEDETPQEQSKNQLPWHERRWNKMFPIIYGHHSVSLGFAILFYPFPGALAAAYLHLLFYILYIVGNLKNLPRMAGIMITLMCVCNVVLMVLGLIGTSYSNYTSDTSAYCKYR